MCSQQVSFCAVQNAQPPTDRTPMQSSEVELIKIMIMCLITKILHVESRQNPSAQHTDQHQAFPLLCKAT